MNKDRFDGIIRPKYEKNDKIWHECHFLSLMHLYEFLSSKPRANRESFPKLASRKNKKTFAGDSYRKALKQLKLSYLKDYKEILTIAKPLQITGSQNIIKSDKVYSPVGSYVDMRRFAMGDPNFMVRHVKREEPKFMTLHYQLAYPHYTTKEAVRHRGLLTLELITLLESLGMHVSLNVFDLSICRNEVFYMTVILKKGSGITIKKDIVYGTTSVEFLRRISFAVCELMAFSNNWHAGGYGEAATADQIEFMLSNQIRENDKIIESPHCHGINGNNLMQDRENFYKSLGFEELIKPKK